MMFNASPRPTVGIEIELGLVDRESLELVPMSDALLAAIRPDDQPEHPKAKHEFYSSSLEIITGICQTLGDARDDLMATITEVAAALDPMGLAMQPGGGHPWAAWPDLIVSDKPRYQEFADRIQWPARRSSCHGIHYHVGVRSGDAAVVIANSMATFLPLLLAPSASSPYWHGQDTGMASARTKVFEGMPTADLPPELAGYDAFVALMADMSRAGAIQTIRELWWDIRPHPNFGTVEIRVCDGMGRLDEVIALGAFAQCLVSDLNDRFDAGEPLPRLPRWALKENKWRAARWGRDAQIVTSSRGDTLPLRQVLDTELARLAPVAKSLGCSAELSAVPAVADEPGYIRQRRTAQETGSLRSVVAELVTNWP